jgi:hypothetical protein
MGMGNAIYILKNSDGTYRGSPLDTVAPNRNMAGTFRNIDEARTAARMYGATIENYKTREVVS